VVAYMARTAYGKLADLSDRRHRRVLGCQVPTGRPVRLPPAIVNPVNGATCQVTRIDTGSVGGPRCESNAGYVMRELPQGVG